MVLDELHAQHAASPEILAEPSPALSIRFDESIVFVRGGPMNDNGQTGRKLVCDYYGPRVPLGGGALSGKDPWRLDRAGAFRARQIALAIVDTGFVSDALVTFAWAPGEQRPSHVQIVVAGGVLAAADTARWLRKYDPSLRATWEELGLARVNYENCARAGISGAGGRGTGCEPTAAGRAYAAPRRRRYRPERTWRADSGGDSRRIYAHAAFLCPSGRRT